MKNINLYTIGFTKKKARYFFEKLKQSGVKRVLDVRLNNVSQLAGFAKRDDLEYFLEQLGGIDYHHLTDLAPTQDILNAYKKQKGDWETYEEQFLELMAKRQIENLVGKEILDGDCLLCSEHEHDHCHRWLVVKYLQDKLGEDAVRVTHLT